MSVSNRVTFTHIKKLFLSLGSTPKPVPLGRWGHTKENQIAIIVDLSNEDHCGTCSNYINHMNNTNMINKRSDQEYEMEYALLNYNTQS
jgi:hypothetical protein